MSILNTSKQTSSTPTFVTTPCKYLTNIRNKGQLLHRIIHVKDYRLSYESKCMLRRSLHIHIVQREDWQKSNLRVINLSLLRTAVSLLLLGQLQIRKVTKNLTIQN